MRVVLLLAFAGLGSLLVLPTPRAAAATGGTAEIVTQGNGTPGSRATLDAGNAGTNFSLKLPDGAACSGDSQGGEYRVQSFMVPASVDPSTLTFDGGGPIPNGLGAALRQPLFQTNTSPFVNGATNVAAHPGGPGVIIDIPAFNLGVLPPAQVPAGDYLVGIACTKGEAGPKQLDRYWSATLHLGSAATPGAALSWTAAPDAAAATSSARSATTVSRHGARAKASAATAVPAAKRRAERAAAETAKPGGEPSFNPPFIGAPSRLALGIGAALLGLLGVRLAVLVRSQRLTKDTI
ncbi:MAG TPA: hypothetical protein VHD87_13290 [Acidimicrobiales bacterium]|nr:hypothetical protein [Acidimicrobiales bacterium]